MSEPAATTGRPAPTVDRRKGQVMSRWVCFDLNGQSFGLPILDVQEVLSEVEIEPVPGAGPDVLGVINLRGAIVSVVDLRRRLHLAERPTDANTRIVVLRNGGEAVGLRVDRVSQVRALPDRMIRTPPATAADVPHHVVRGVYSSNNDFVTLLDASALLA